jgi:Na+-transporting NADH:ubiquinone oxidoreductase subunit C
VQHSNGYTIVFAAIVCAICGAFVAVSAVSLKPLQDKNVVLDRQRNVLSVAGLIQPGESVSADELSALFEQFVKPRVIDLATGEDNATVDAGTFNQAKAAKDPARSSVAPSNAAKVRRLPNQALVYEVIKDGKYQSLIIPIEGMGLWGTLYGYIALATDATTIRGITYYQHKETPGLGGEVDNPRWKGLWVGRKAFDGRGNLKIAVKKGIAGPVDTDPYSVDGLAGATLTSRGVTNMLRFWLGEQGFGPFIEKYRSERGT